MYPFASLKQTHHRVQLMSFIPWSNVNRNFPCRDSKHPLPLLRIDQAADLEEFGATAGILSCAEAPSGTKVSLHHVYIFTQKTRWL